MTATRVMVSSRAGASTMSGREVSHTMQSEEASAISMASSSEIKTFS